MLLSQFIIEFGITQEQAQQRRRRKEQFLYNMATGTASGGALGSLAALGTKQKNPVPYIVGGSLLGGGLASYYTRKNYNNRKKETNLIEKYKNNKLYGK